MTTDISTLAPRRILACQLRQIGDVIVSTACIELLARRWPEAEIHFLTEAKCAPVLEHNPRLARVWTMDPAKGLPATLGAALALRRQRFDLLVDFQQLPRTGLAAALSHAPVRLAPGGKWYKRLPYT
ncbi:MAG: glycosyltransferase family 9 protein, partial [Desulfovibrionaceae bacterium]